MLRSCDGRGIIRYWIGAGVLWSSLVAVDPTFAQDPSIQARAEYTLRDPLTGRAQTQQGIVTSPSDPLPEFTEQAFTNTFAIVAPPGGTNVGYFRADCSVGSGPRQVLPAKIFNITVRSFGANGHTHSGTPPKGFFYPTNGHTDSDLNFATTYAAPSVAAYEAMTVNYQYDLPGHPCNGYRFNVTFPISARVKGVIPLVAGEFMKLEPRDFSHGAGNVLFVDPSMNPRVQAMAREYYQIARRLLRVHTASLPQGGLFDINSDYASPLENHRNGTDIDVSGGVTTNATEKLIEAGRRAGLVCAEAHGAVHCSLP